MTSDEISQYIRLRCVEDGGCLRWYTKAKTAVRRRHPLFRFPGDRKPQLARRALFEAEKGRPIRPGHSLAPGCGDDCCILPEHQKELSAPQVSRLGARVAKKSPTRSAKVRAARAAAGLSTLNDPQLRQQIRTSDDTCTAWAERLNVSIKAISDLRLGKTWPDGPLAANDSTRRAA